MQGACVESGQLLSEVDVNEETLSELLRCYISASCNNLEEVSDHAVIIKCRDIKFFRCVIDSKLEQVSYLRKEQWKISIKLKCYRQALSSQVGPDIAAGSSIITTKYGMAKRLFCGRPPKRPYQAIGTTHV